MELLTDIIITLLATVRDVLPIAAILFGFQFLVLRRSIPHLKRVLSGFGFVLAGLALFLLGLEEALFPVGKLMAQQLTDPAFLGIDVAAIGDEVAKHWYAYYWVYIFAFMIGFATTVAEPSLIAVAI